MNRYIALMRPVNAIMASIGTIVGGVVAEQSLSAALDFRVYIAMAVVFLVLLGGNVLNDYFDVETDRINHPKRPIPSGKISLTAAKFLAIILFALGLVVSFFTFNVSQILIAILAIFLLSTYEWKTKAWGVAGNIIISSLVGLIFVYGSLSIKFSFVVIILALMAFLANLAREIVKDVEDVKGDINRTTLPKKIGKTLSLLAAAIFVAFAVSLSPIPYLFFGWRGLYIPAVAISDLIFIASVFFFFNNQTRGQNLIKIAMIIGLIAFLVGNPL